MPTGYTSAIYEGEEVSAKDYILKCARAFGATVTMRDEPLTKKIPEFEPSTYHKDSLEKAKKDLEKYKNMSIIDIEKELEESYQDGLKRYYERINEYDELKNRYVKLLNEVKEWNPPTEEHEELKKFAIDQLENSIEYDCSTKYMVIPEKLDAQEWLNNKIESAKRDIEYHQKGWNEEVQRTNERNQWVKALKDSLQ